MAVRQTILVVDDDSPVRKLACDMLSQSGYECLQAGDGEEALRLLEDGVQVDLLLTDAVMPGMSGHDLVGYAALLRPGLRIVMMSGYDDQPPAAQEAGFIAKPFTAAALNALLRRALEAPVSPRRFGSSPSPA